MDKKESVPGPRQSFVREPRSLDTLVFIHGLLGHFVGTWGRFPELLDQDPDLPDLDILLWGYRSGLRPWDPSLDAEAERLFTALRLLVSDGAKIHLVGHSMGGLLIFSGLTREMRDGRAREGPCGLVSGLTLYATPVKGSMMVGVLKLTLGRFYFFRHLVNRQLRQLAQGSYVDKLIGEVVERVYRPEIEPGDLNSRRRIPIQICVGNRDSVVTYEEAVGIFAKPPPLRLDWGHKKIKLPESRVDLRYLALKRDLEKNLSQDFADLCQRCDDRDEEAQYEFSKRYESKLRFRLDTVFRERRELLEAAMLEELLVLVWRIGAGVGGRPGEVFDRALIQLKRIYEGS